MEASDSGQDIGPTTTLKTDEPPTNYPKGLSLFLICTGLSLSVLCLGLDRTIVSTAIPKITSDFNSLPDIGWYGSAYMLTSCCFQLIFGKLYAELDIKWLFLFALAIFEVGSIICAAAPNSAALIIGRAVAGIGAAGILTGALVILAHSVSLRNRPRVTGIMGGVVGISQMIAPTLGGVFTDYLTWRWCFWISLPLGAVTLAAVFFLVHLPASATTQWKGGSAADIFRRFDLLGNSVLIPSVVSLLLALEWGGTKYAWSSWRVILTLTVFSVTILAWGAIQYVSGDNATVPLRIIRGRSMASAMWYTFCIMGVFFTLVQFIPVWFQSIKDDSAYQSGIDLLASTVPLSVFIVVSGFLTSKIGYYVPQMIVGTVATSVATGMITVFGLDTNTSYWIGTLILLGFGLGIGAQQPVMIPQTVLTGPDISLGTSVIIFSQTISGTVWVSVANNIFHDTLVSELAARAPTVDPEAVVLSGASEIPLRLGPIYPDAIGDILASYSTALQKLWIIPLVLSCLSAIALAFVEWKSVKGPDPRAPTPSGDEEKTSDPESVT
ncbi:hypothetical protein OQA88_2337 [Cercophora sp. LCS_1]